MCQDCFDRHWEGREDEFSELQARYWNNAQFHHKIETTSRLIYVASDEGDVSGPLHVGVEDDNYGCDAYVTEQFPMPHEWIDACAAWDALNEDERSFVCARLHEYDTPEFGREFS